MRKPSTKKPLTSNIPSPPMMNQSSQVGSQAVRGRTQRWAIAIATPITPISPKMSATSE